MPLPHEPVSGWFVAAHHNPLKHNPRASWPFRDDHYKVIVDSPTVNDGGSCRVTLANGQRVIVRAKL